MKSSAAVQAAIGELRSSFIPGVLADTFQEPKGRVATTTGHLESKVVSRRRVSRRLALPTFANSAALTARR
jgi:hypothetical protein